MEERAREGGDEEDGRRWLENREEEGGEGGGGGDVLRQGEKVENAVMQRGERMREGRDGERERMINVMEKGRIEIDTDIIQRRNEEIV